jgi:hypothetical protein
MEDGDFFLPGKKFGGDQNNRQENDSDDYHRWKSPLGNEGLNRLCLTLAHEASVSYYIRTQNSGELALAGLCGHRITHTIGRLDCVGIRIDLLRSDV